MKPNLSGGTAESANEVIERLYAKLPEIVAMKNEGKSTEELGMLVVLAREAFVNLRAALFNSGPERIQAIKIVLGLANLL